MNEPNCINFYQVGNKELRVHKTVLAARSTVLAAMLSHDTEETQKGSMSITDLDAEVR